MRKPSLSTQLCIGHLERGHTRVRTSRNTMFENLAYSFAKVEDSVRKEALSRVCPRSGEWKSFLADWSEESWSTEEGQSLFIKADRACRALEVEVIIALT